MIMATSNIFWGHCLKINVKMFCSCHVEQHLLYLKKTYNQLHRYGRLVVVVHYDDVCFVLHFWATKQRNLCILPQVCLKLWTEEPTDTQQSPTYLQYAGLYKGPSPFRLNIQHVSTSALSAWWYRKEGSNLGLKMRAESPSTDKTTIDLKDFHPFSAQNNAINATLVTGFGYPIGPLGLYWWSQNKARIRAPIASCWTIHGTLTRSLCAPDIHYFIHSQYDDPFFQGPF